MPFRKLTTDTERFWRNVDRTTTPDGCWLWTGYIATNGYGEMSIGSRTQGDIHMIGAHRFALQLAIGRPIAPGMFVCHSCDVRACCRAAHLWEGTTQDNTADRDAKDRGARGTRHTKHVFTDDDIRDIRQRAANGERPIDLAREYEVWNTAIHKIIHREAWKHVL